MKTLLECLDSDADPSVVIVRLQWLISNDCVSAHWSPMYQYLALTSPRDSHRLPKRHIREPGNVRRLFFSLPYFHFRTSVSVLRFPYFSIFHFPLNHSYKQAMKKLIEDI